MRVYDTPRLRFLTKHPLSMAVSQSCALSNLSYRLYGEFVLESWVIPDAYMFVYRAGCKSTSRYRCSPTVPLGDSSQNGAISSPKPRAGERPLLPAHPTIMLHPHPPPRGHGPGARLSLRPAAGAPRRARRATRGPRGWPHRGIVAVSSGHRCSDGENTKTRGAGASPVSRRTRPAPPATLLAIGPRRTQRRGYSLAEKSHGRRKARRRGAPIMGCLLRRRW